VLLQTIIFADDTNIFISGKNVHEMENRMNSQLTLLVTWLQANKLSLNIKKTNFMVFRPRNCRSLSSIDIKINGISINEEQSTKFLGVIIDNKFTWKQHIQYTANKISKCIGIINKAKKYLDHTSLVSLYYSFLYPYLSYCIIVWGGTYPSNLDSLIKAQKSAVRCICNKSKRSNTSQLFKQLNILKLMDIYHINTAMFMFKFYNKSLPSIFSDYFTYNINIHSYGTRQKNKIHVPKFKTNLGKETVKYTGSVLFNLLIDKVEFCCSLDLFKKSIKLYFQSSY
jgi:hypothetical protein